MSEPSRRSTEPSRAGELERARQSVLATIETWSGDASQPSLHTPAPLGSPPDAVRARVAARVAAGLSPLGTDSPTDDLPRRVVIPCAVLAAADAVGIVVTALTGHLVLTVIAAVLFLPLAGIAISAARYAAHDPLRLSADDRAALDATCRWRSRQPWAEQLARNRERGLLEAVMCAAERAASSAAWKSTLLDSAGVRINLATELERTDAEAFALAGERREDADRSPQRWDALLDRAALLTCYADRLVTADGRAPDTAGLAALVTGGQPA